MLFTDETPVDHHQVPRLCIKSTRGTILFETGTANRRQVEPGKETSLEPLKHTLFGEQFNSSEITIMHRNPFQTIPVYIYIDIYIYIYIYIHTHIYIYVSI